MVEVRAIQHQKIPLPRDQVLKLRSLSVVALVVLPVWKSWGELPNKERFKRVVLDG